MTAPSARSRSARVRSTGCQRTRARRRTTSTGRSPRGSWPRTVIPSDGGPGERTAGSAASYALIYGAGASLAAPAGRPLFLGVRDALFDQLGVHVADTG